MFIRGVTSKDYLYTISIHTEYRLLTIKLFISFSDSTEYHDQLNNGKYNIELKLNSSNFDTITNNY